METIQGRKLLKGGNYIGGNTVDWCPWQLINLVVANFEYLFWFFPLCLLAENNNKYSIFKIQNSTHPNWWVAGDIRDKKNLFILRSRRLENIQLLIIMFAKPIFWNRFSLPMICIITPLCFYLLKRQLVQEKACQGSTICSFLVCQRDEYRVNLAQVWLFHLELPFAFQSCKWSTNRDYTPVGRSQSVFLVWQR